MLQTIVQVTSLEMVRNARNLRTGHVEQVGLVLGQLVNLGLEWLRLAIIEDNDLEPVKRIVLGTSSTNRVHDHRIILSTASDENIDSRHIITGKPQLGPTTALGRPHGPNVVQHGRDGDHDLNGKEDPCLDVNLTSSILSRDDTGDTEDQVDDVEDDVEEGEDGDEVVDVALPAVPGVDVVAVMEVLDCAGLGVAFCEGG